MTDARLLLRHVDPELGKPLEEKSYGGNCLLYDPDHPDPFHNIWDKLDLFVPMHFFGWWLKTMILRDWWLCSVVSIMFEILEYTLEHQLPNFSECWWDHVSYSFPITSRILSFFGWSKDKSTLENFLSFNVIFFIAYLRDS